jgi:organic hydroperoxide reductase OsmC/OhrA
MSDTHSFEATLRWPADPQQTLPPDPAFSRNNTLGSVGKPDVPGSAPTVYGGDASRYNPEELLLMSLSECHILGYTDRATGTLGMGPSGKMQMTECVLRPVVTVPRGSAIEELTAMHDKAKANCFMANSVNFPVRHEPEFIEV